MAAAKLTGRTLVLPRWRPQYGCPWMGETDEYFNVDVLRSLVSCITLKEFALRRASAAHAGEGRAGARHGATCTTAVVHTIMYQLSGRVFFNKLDLNLVCISVYVTFFIFIENKFSVLQFQALV